MRQIVLVPIGFCLVFSTLSAQQPPAAPETAPVAQAQATAKPMTNDDVLAMIEAKFPEESIILAIRNAPSHAFDTSVPTLIDLKKKGVSQAILDVMQSPTPPAQPQMPAMPQMPEMPWVASAKQVPGLPAELGVYVKNASGFTPLRQAPMAGSKMKYGAGAPFGFARTAMKWDGASAETQLTESKPILYVFQSGWDERSIRILRLTVKDQTRELVVKRTQAAPRKEDIVDVDTTVIVKGQFPIYTVTPKVPLMPGEYLVSAQELGWQGYEFGIKTAPVAPKK